MATTMSSASFSSAPPASSPLQSGMPIVPISALQPQAARWCIKARVTAKSETKSWKNQRGAGSMFKVDLLDEQGTEISAAFFNDGASKFNDMIQVNGVYYFSGGRVKIADSRYSQGRNMYEINFDDKASIRAASDDDLISKLKVTLLPISCIDTMAPNRVVDIMGIVTSVGEAVTVKSKAGKEMTKRDVTVADASSSAIDVTVWGDKANNATSFTVGSPLLIKGARVSDWNHRSLSTGQNSHIEASPNTTEAHALTAWYTTGGASSAIKTLSDRTAGRDGSGSFPSGGNGGGMTQGPILDMSQRYTVSSLKDDFSLAAADANIAVVKGTVKSIRNEPEKIAYPACRSQRENRVCNKKLEQSSSGWNCSSCGPQTAPEYRYMLNVAIQDATNEHYVTLFNTEAEQLLGIKADALFTDPQNQKVNPAGIDVSNPAYANYFTNALFKQALFSVRCKLDTRPPTSGGGGGGGGNEMRMQTTVAKLRILGSDAESYPKECKALLENIRKYMA